MIYNSISFEKTFFLIWSNTTYQTQWETEFFFSKCVSEILSDTITYAPKRPLQTPQREWLGNDLKVYIDKHISLIENSEFNSWFNIDRLKDEWQK